MNLNPNHTIKNINDVNEQFIDNKDQNDIKNMSRRKVLINKKLLKIEQESQSKNNSNGKSNLENSKSVSYLKTQKNLNKSNDL